MATRVKFDAARYTKKMKMRGTQVEYLPAGRKIQMMFARYPDAQVTIEPVSVSDTSATLKAIVSLPNGGKAEALATVHKADFTDFLEKCDTKATARACTKLGFDLDGPYDEFAEGYAEIIDEEDIPTLAGDVTAEPDENPASLITPSGNLSLEGFLTKKNDVVEPAQPVPEQNDTSIAVNSWDDYKITDFSYKKDTNVIGTEDASIARDIMHDSGYSSQTFLRHVFFAEEDAYKTKKIRSKPKAFARLEDVPVSLMDKTMEWIEQRAEN